MLDASISASEIKINGYDIAKKNRNRHGERVAIYLRNSLYSYTVRDDRTVESLGALYLRSRSRKPDHLWLIVGIVHRIVHKNT